MAGPSQRASDAEREAAAERVRSAGAEGRLDADELEERLGAAYGARTTGELERLTADLPVPAPATPRVPVRQAPAVRRKLATFLIVNVTCIAVWLATGAGDGSFWPGWVLLGTGIALFSALVRTALGVDDDEEGPPAGDGERRAAGR